MVDQEKCTMQSVPNVDRNVKFLSNLTKADPSIAENVTLNEDPREEIDIKLSPASIYFWHSIFLYSFFFLRGAKHQYSKYEECTP
jgi:hypothetical protein